MQMAQPEIAPAPVLPAKADVHIEAMRGVLILLVILDHNDLIRDVRSVNAWFLPMTFHVAGFLLLPFLVDRRPLTWKSAGDHAIRYLVPFLFALVLYSTAYFVLILHGRLPLHEISAFAVAFLIASPRAVQAATGFIVLWFLPALCTLVLLIGIHKKLYPPLKQPFLGATIVVHLLVGSFPGIVKDVTPQGLLIALSIFPLGVLTRKILPYVLKENRLIWAAVGIAAVGAGWLLERGSEVEVATLVLPTVDRPFWVLATDASDIGFFVALAICSPFLNRLPGIGVLGRYSLVVYLIHPLLYKPIFAALALIERHGPGADPASLLYWAFALLSVVLVASLSLAIAATIQAVPTSRRLLTPRNLDDWLVPR